MLPVVTTRKRNRIFWKCKCDCGKIVNVSSNNLRNRQTRSCGCLANDVKSKRTTTRGMYGTRIYNIWRGIKRRCLYNYPNYDNVKICSEWEKVFYHFISGR